MLKARIYTALILIPLAIAAIFLLPASIFNFVTAIIVLLAAWEWTRLVGYKQLIVKVFYLIVIADIIGIAYFVDISLLLWMSLLWWCIATYLVVRYPLYEEWWKTSPISKGVVGLLTLVPCWISIMHIRQMGAGFLLLAFVIVWGADSGAYFVGRRYGKQKLAPLVSPGKTVEGVIGGVVTAMIIGLIGAIILRLPLLHIFAMVILSGFVAVISVVGDLFESMVKRYANVKDSGHILPGHGGVLDRIDSLTAAMPLFALGLWLLM